MLDTTEGLALLRKEMRSQRPHITGSYTDPEILGLFHKYMADNERPRDITEQTARMFATNLYDQEWRKVHRPWLGDSQ